jgi:hypothetical protein
MQISAIRPATTGASAVHAARGAGAVRATPAVTPVAGGAARGVTPAPATPAAVVQWSQQALGLARGSEGGAAHEAGETNAASSSAATPAAEPTPEQQQEIQELERRDREVRAHEQAHKSAGGAHAGSIHLEYTVGPDGKRYASSGEVSIDVSAVPGDPEATLRKMQVVQRAANAPAEPSGADRQVAAQAAATASRARAEMAAERYGAAQQLGAATRTAQRERAEPEGAV